MTVVDELIAVAFPPLDPGRELHDNTARRFYRADDPRLPLRARFVPTAHGILDVLRYRLLCLCCHWTDTADLPSEQRVYGRIDCAHCGAMVQRAGVVDRQVPRAELTPEGMDLDGVFPDGRVAAEYEPDRWLSSNDYRRAKSYRANDPDVTLDCRFAPTFVGIWDLVTHEVLCRRCGQWTDSRRFPGYERLLGRMLCQHCGTIIQT